MGKWSADTPCFILVCLCLMGCGADYDVQMVAGPVDVPDCVDVAVFGNGAVCLNPAGEADLALCDAHAPACSPEEVCFDAAALLVCRCAEDAECGEWGAHVNGALSEAGLSSVEVGCELGRCSALGN